MHHELTDKATFLLTAGMDAFSFARLDALRREYFPRERNSLPAHITLFHNLRATHAEAFLPVLLGIAASSPCPLNLAFPSLAQWGPVVSAQVASPALHDLHQHLTQGLGPWLPQADTRPFRPHVTIINKSGLDAANHVLNQLSPTWQDWQGYSAALLLWRYNEGAWEPEGQFPLSHSDVFSDFLEFP